MRFDPRPLPHEVVIPNDLRTARRTEEDILRKIEALGWSPESAFGLRLALEEAIVNAHRHGNCCDPGKTITVSYDITPQRAVIRVRDEGPGFDPHCVPDPTNPDRISLPNGRGIMLMRAYLDDLAFNEQGNEVQLLKERA
jgi:serine/threonine-protein kinase RsbW